MPGYVALWVKRYYLFAFFSAVVCVLVVYFAHDFYQYPTVMRLTLFVVVCMAFCSFFGFFSMIFLLMKVLITLGTGHGWKKRQFTAKRLGRCKIADGVVVPVAECYLVVVWSGIVIPAFVERIEAI